MNWGGRYEKAISECGMMRCVLSVLLVVFLGARASAEMAGAALYNEANAFYRAGKYAEAVEQYEAVLRQGVRNGHVYYNLGNAYFKAGQIGRAILAYERALRLMPGDEDVAANLRFVNAMKVDREPEGKENVVVRFLRRIYRALSANGLAVFCSICLFCLAGAGAGWLFSPRRRMLWVSLLVLLGVGFFGAGALMTFKVHDREGVERAVILSEEVVGRSGPGKDYLQVFTLHEGTRVTIEREEGGWLLVRLSNGIGGWVPVEGMEQI